jgi:hypothetical protein
VNTIPVDQLPRTKERRQLDELSEHDHQVQVIKWAVLQVKCGTYPDLDVLHAIPNAGRRTRGEVGWMLSEGLKSGVPDLHLPVARGGWKSLYIEMKSERGRVSKSQAWWQSRLYQLGHCVVTCFTHVQAEETLVEYLDGKLLK